MSSFGPCDMCAGLNLCHREGAAGCGRADMRCVIHLLNSNFGALLGVCLFLELNMWAMRAFYKRDFLSLQISCI